MKSRGFSASNSANLVGLFLSFWLMCLMPGLGRKLIHDLSGFANLTVDSAWKLQGCESGIQKDSLMVLGFLMKEKKDARPDGLICQIFDPPRHLFEANDGEVWAKMAAGSMVKAWGVNRDGEIKKDRLILTQSKELGPEYSVFRQKLSVEDASPMIVSGVVWKSSRRVYCLTTFREDKHPGLGFWKDIVDGLKEDDRRENLYAESYRRRDQFLSPKQKEELTKVLNSQAVGTLELTGIREKLAKKKSQELQTELKTRTNILEARGMRLIYFGLLDDEQRKQFDASMKRRMSGG
jgi:hypothetical protein